MEQANSHSLTKRQRMIRLFGHTSVASRTPSFFPSSAEAPMFGLKIDAG